MNTLKKFNIACEVVMKSIWSDISYNFSKPKEILNSLSYLFMILILTDRFFWAKVIGGAMIFLYIWKIYSSGDIRKLVRERHITELEKKG